MKKLTQKKIIGLVLCIIFIESFWGPSFYWRVNLYSLFGYVGVDYGSPILYLAFWALITLMLCSTLLYAGLHKDLFNSKIGSIAAFALAGINILYIIGSFSVVLGYDLLLLSSVYLNVILLFRFLFVIVFLLSIKTWLPAKIAGIVSYIPSVIIFFMVSKFVRITDSEHFEALLSSIQTCEVLNAILNLAAVMIVVVWMFQRIAPSPSQKDSIDLI